MYNLVPVSWPQAPVFLPWHLVEPALSEVLPAGHLRQAVCWGLGWYHPAGQGTHSPASTTSGVYNDLLPSVAESE